MKKLLTLAVTVICTADMFGNVKTASDIDNIPQIFKDYKEDMKNVAEKFEAVNSADSIPVLLSEWAEIMCPYTTSSQRITSDDRDSLNVYSLNTFKSSYYAFFRCEGNDLEDELNKKLFEDEFKTVSDAIIDMTQSCRTLGIYSNVLIEYIDPKFNCNSFTGQDSDDKNRRNNSGNIKTPIHNKTTELEGHYSSTTTNSTDCGVYDNENTEGTTAPASGHNSTSEGEIPDCTGYEYDEKKPGLEPNANILYDPKHFITEAKTSDITAYITFYGNLAAEIQKCTSKEQCFKLLKDSEPEFLRFMQSTAALNSVNRKALVESSLYYAPRIAIFQYRLMGMEKVVVLIEYLIGARIGVSSVLGNRKDVTEMEIKMLDKLLNVIPSLRKMLYDIADQSNTLGEFLNNTNVTVSQISESVMEAKKSLFK